MEGSGTLEEQLEAIRAKSVEIRSRKVELKQIEELGARLEERLILDNRYTEHSTVRSSNQRIGSKFQNLRFWGCSGIHDLLEEQKVLQLLILEAR